MATKKILANLDLIQNELQNAVIQVLASDPATGKLGQIYYNSTNKALMQYDGAKWNRVGVVYQQDSTTGAVITGLDASGNVTTTNVTGLTLTGYTPVEGGYVTAGMTMQEAMNAMDTAIKNAVAGGGEVNQNAWSKISIPAQSTATTAVTGQAEDVVLSSDAKVDTFVLKTGNKWVDINGSGKTVNIGHSLSGATVLQLVLLAQLIVCPLLPLMLLVISQMLKLRQLRLKLLARLLLLPLKRHKMQLLRHKQAQMQKWLLLRLLKMAALKLGVLRQLLLLALN